MNTIPRISTESCDGLDGAIKHLATLKRYAAGLDELFSYDWIRPVKNSGGDSRNAGGMFIESLRVNRHNAATAQLRFVVCVQFAMSELESHHRYEEIRGALPSSFFGVDFEGYSKEAYAFLRSIGTEMEKIQDLSDVVRRHFFDWMEEARAKSEDGRIALEQYTSDSVLILKPLLFLDVVLSGAARLHLFAESLDVIRQGVNGDEVLKIPAYELEAAQ